MRYVVLLTRRVFSWQHQGLMARGQQGLARYLNRT
jgi:hypothetical protein